MANRGRQANRPTKPLVRAPLRVGALDAAGVVAELRDLHERAEDPDIERMPSDEEIFGALLYLEKHVDALRGQPDAARQAAALKRVRLWEYLREQAERHQARAVEDARAVGASWAQLAPALAVKVPSAAYNKAKRLKAADLTDETPQALPLRRTPEAVLRAERRLLSDQAAEQRAQGEARRKHRLLVPLASALLGNREELVLEDDAEYWLDEVEAVLPHCHTSSQMLSLNRYLEAAVRELRKQEVATARPVARTHEAYAALTAVREFYGSADSPARSGEPGEPPRPGPRPITP